MEMLTKSLAFKTDNIGDDGVFEGYAAIFGNVDAWGDVIEPGAFKKTLAEHKAKDSRPKMFWQHNSDEIIGKWEYLAEDKKGLLAKGRLYIDCAENPLARKAHFLLKERELDGLSIGYYARDYSMDEKTWIRTLKEIELLETSLVTFPANDQARVSVVKGSPSKTIREFEAFLRDVGGFSAQEAKRIASIGFKSRDVAEPSKEATEIINAIIGNYK